MIPIKRSKLAMDEDSSSWIERLRAELESLKDEIEVVDMRKSPATRKDTISYRPTYRAVLSRRSYLVKQTLGSGSYSKVKLAYYLEDDATKWAVKIIDRSKAPKDFQIRFLQRELSVWPKLCHPNIVRMIDMFEDDHRVYMILEYAENGDVLRYIQKSGAIKDELARAWIRQVCDAVRYLHEQNISHRDLKLENLLLDSAYNTKIGDFGFVKENCTEELSKTYCGSKSYAAPEILRGEPYDTKKADIWAIGVILYIFITGKMPFDESKGNHGVLDEQRKLNFPWHKFRNVTTESKSFILWLFQNNFKERPDIHTVLSTDWMKIGPRDENLSEKTSEGSRFPDKYPYFNDPEIQKQFAAALQKAKTK